MLVEPTEEEIRAQLVDQSFDPPRQRSRETAEAIAHAIANRNSPRGSYKELAKQSEALHVIRTAERNDFPGGPIRITKMDGKLTELGKQREREYLAKKAAAENATEAGKQGEEKSQKKSVS